MGVSVLILRRPPILGFAQLERIEAAMLRILETVGIAVLEEDVLKGLRGSGFEVRGNRVLIPRRVATAFLEAERTRNGRAFSASPHPVEPAEAALDLSVSPYPQRFHDPETDRVVPFDTKRLVEATRLVDVLSDRGVVSSPPGCPSDVPPPLQPIVQYWVAATQSRQGRRPVDAKSGESMPYVMEMAEALGNPLRHLPIYVFSPLSLGGESLRCVLRFRDRLSSVGVSDMSSMGCTAPIRAGNAFALSAAEVVGSAILVGEAVGLPVRWSIRVCPVDFSSLAMVLGSPEDFLLQLANAEVNAYLHGTGWHPGAAGLHTSAKLPGAQACAEKASLMTAGALLGTRRFGVAGTLSLDEVFSPEQLLYDLEIRDHARRLVEGLDGGCDPEACLQEVIEGVRERGFAGLETTLNAYRGVYWRPKLFERQFAAGWEGGGAKTIRQKARAMIPELLSRHEFELEPDRRREVDRILERAKVEWMG